MKNTDKKLEFECYKTTAQAIGLMELLGNMQPTSQQIRLVEKIILKLRLTWKACEDAKELKRSLNHR